jgi:P-type Cu+ transporter
LLAAAAAVESASEHPLAQAIVQGAKARGLEVAAAKDFRSITGGGVEATVAEEAVIVGQPTLLTERGVRVIDELVQLAAEHQSQGASVVYVAIDQQLAGAIVIADTIRPQAAESIHQLRELGIEIWMLTGDNEKTAQAVALQLGIEHVEAGMKPEDKHRRVVELRQQGRRVAMAGDGINDAPALAAADVGIAMGTGTDVAIESADVTLLHGDLAALVRAVHLSGAVMGNIRQNLAFAFGYNLLGVPIAAGVLYPMFGLLLSPMLAAAAMSLSSVSVISNSLRLRGVRL